MPITASAGVATYPGHAGDADTLVRAADDALYESKRAGRNRTTVSAGVPPEAQVDALDLVWDERGFRPLDLFEQARERTGYLVVLVVLGWTTIARVVRAEVLALKEREFVQAARAMGASRAWFPTRVRSRAVPGRSRPTPTPGAAAADRACRRW